MTTTTMRIDAHHHLWDLSVRRQDWIDDDPTLAPINRSYGEPDLAPLAAAAGVDATVLVQTVPVAAETPELLDLAAASDLVAAVTGWVDVTAPDVADTVAALLEHPHADRLRAIRAQVQAQPDPRWVCRDDVRHGLRAIADAGLLVEVVTLPAQLPALAETAAALPGATVVLDHAGKPDLRTGDLQDWAASIRRLGALPHVVVKLSGLVTEADWQRWDEATLRPVADALLESFGPDRVMLGSDWPVCEVAGDYVRVVEAYRSLLADLSPGERAAVEGGTAARVYGIDEAVSR